MKRTLSLVALLTLAALNLTLAPRVDAQVLPGPALMNFQGRLARPDGTAVADGDYSIMFSLWDAVAAGNQKWTQTLPTVAVANGVFDVLLDVGTAGLFSGDLWLEIQIGTDVPLSPRQQLVSAAYAMKANTVPDGSIGAAQIAASSIPADKLVAGTLNPVAWLLAGNSGTLPGSQFLGTTDNQPLIFRANNVEQMRIGAGGQVGIGTASPLAKLHVSGGSLRLDSGQELSFTDLGQIRSGDNNHRILFRRTENKLELREYGDLIFSPGAISGNETAQVVMRNNGNVGIGVPNPTARLEVNGDVKAANFVGSGAALTALPPNAALLGANQIFSGLNTFGQGVTVNGLLQAGNLTVLPQNALNEGGEILLKGAGTNPDWRIDNLANQVRIFSGGVVTAVVRSNQFQVVGSILARGGPPGALGVNNNGYAFTGNGGDNDSGLFSSADGQLEFYGNSVERMRLSTVGNLGIGTINPTAKLHVNGSVKVDGANTLEFGAGIAGKEANAGKIGYQVFTPDALDIVGAGTTGASRKIRFWSEAGATFAGNIAAPSATIPTLNGNVSVNGEMTAKVVTITGGSDVAEPYHVANAGDIKPIAGMVVAIDSEQIGQMRVAAQAYDKTVAGILSGANGISPGITLRQAGTVADGTLPVASIGRVWCYCDADANGSIEAGDMLTTSDTPGHAMKVGDFDRANGSVIGKAMSKLKSGRGLVLVLVSLK